MVASGARGGTGERAERLRRLTEKTRLLEERIRALEDKVQACRGDDGEPDNSLTSRVSRLETLLASMSLVQGGRTVRFSGVNVQIVSGLGTTNGDRNGLGNLIVGYNESRGTNDGECDPSSGPSCEYPILRDCNGPDGEDCYEDRWGSHNIIVGADNNYSSTGGLVVGNVNGVYAPAGVVLGGARNEVSGARGVVVGGEQNNASGGFSTVVGGTVNHAGGAHSFVGGGVGNSTANWTSTVVGGTGNSARGQEAVVVGGIGNTAEGEGSTVGGGRNRRAVGEVDWVAGGLFQDD